MDNVKVDSMFMKQIISRIVKTVVQKKLGIGLKSLRINDFEITHEDNGDAKVHIDISGSLNEVQIKMLLDNIGLLGKG